MQTKQYKKKPIPAASRRELATRHGCKPGGSVLVVCECGNRGSVYWDVRNRQKMGYVSFIEMEIDHIIPEFLGGSGQPENLRLCCRTCNRKKGHRAIDGKD
jgi:5-methylcytosine-specific restriction endonuclease McrA